MTTAILILAAWLVIPGIFVSWIGYRWQQVKRNAAARQRVEEIFQKSVADL